MKRIGLALAVMMALVACASTANAAILNTALRLGPNTINDTNGDRYIPITGPAQTVFMVGDIFDSVLVFENISNASFLNKDLEDATGKPTYQMSALSSLTITAVIPVAPGFVHLALAGTISVYETTDLTKHVDFTTDTFAGATAKVLATTNILNLTTDFYQQPFAPSSIAAVPAFPGLTADGGFSITSNPGNVPIVPGVTATTYVSIFTGLPTTTFHDLVARVQLFKNTGVNATEFPFLSDTTVRFEATVPEPASVAVWGGLLFGCAAFGYRRRKKARAA